MALELCGYKQDGGSVEAITFMAQVYKVQTLVDGGIRVTLDLPETDIKSMTELVKVKQAGAVLEVAAVPVLQESNRNNGKVQTRSEWQP